MMTSVVSNQSRGTRDKTLPTTTQTTQPQKQIQVGFQRYIYSIILFCWYCLSLLLFSLQATAEQIRLAQMIYDKNDADFEDKVKQVS